MFPIELLEILNNVVTDEKSGAFLGGQTYASAHIESAKSKILQMEEDEINTYIKYLDKLHSSYSFLNSYAWRMTELNKNLDDALIKVDEALTLIDNSTPQYPNILDTKAEILWKLGNIEEAVKIIQDAIDIDPSSE